MDTFRLIFHLLTRDQWVSLIIGTIPVAIAIVGYFFHSFAQRRHERYKLKVEAYSKFLGIIELLLPDKPNQVLGDNEKIRLLNQALAELMLKAPVSVINRIKKEIFEDGQDRFGRTEIKKLQLILHNDVYPSRFSKQLNIQSFPHLPFQ